MYSFGEFCMTGLRVSFPTLNLRMQNVHDIAQEAIENARFVCEEHYALFKGPPVELICPKDLTFPYVPGHLFVRSPTHRKPRSLTFSYFDLGRTLCSSCSRTLCVPS